MLPELKMYTNIQVVAANHNVSLADVIMMSFCSARHCINIDWLLAPPIL